MNLLTKAEAIALIQKAESIAEIPAKTVAALSSSKNVRVLVLR